MFNSFLSYATQPIVSFGLSQLMDTSCESYPNLCRVCDFLNAMAPNLFDEGASLMEPAFSYRNELLLFDQRIKSSIHLFESQMRDNRITNVSQIPLVIFINKDRSSITSVAAHSFLLFIIPVPGGPPVAFTLGLSVDEKNKILIGSPDYNPFLRKQMRTPFENDLMNYSCNFTSTRGPPGRLIIKAIEPLTFSYIKNFRDYLYGNIVDAFTDQEVIRNKKGKDDYTSATEIMLETKLDYTTLSMGDRNCAGFAEMLSMKKKSQTSSVQCKIAGLISNPSSMSSRFFTPNGLNTFIGNAIEEKQNPGSGESKSLSWLLNLYRYLYENEILSPEVESTLGGRIKRTKRNRMKKTTRRPQHYKSKHIKKRKSTKKTRI